MSWLQRRSSCDLSVAVFYLLVPLLLSLSHLTLPLLVCLSFPEESVRDLRPVPEIGGEPFFCQVGDQKPAGSGIDHRDASVNVVIFRTLRLSQC